MDQSEYYRKKRKHVRLNPDLDNIDSVHCYFRNHSIHILHTGMVWSGIVEPIEEWGAETSWVSPGGEVGYSVYIFASHRSKGHMSNWLKENNATKMIYTASSCALEGYLKRKGARYKVILGDVHSPFDPEYELVADFYGDSVTDRTGVHMINHIDEGIWVLQQIGASDTTIRSYIIHPLVQGDAELRSFWESSLDLRVSNPRVLHLALEYRNIANAHLSWHPPASEASFNDSPINEVNQMLVADKVQNCKDFELYHLGTNLRSDRLASYFEEWLEKLNIKGGEYKSLRDKLLERTGGKRLALLQRQIAGQSDATIREHDQLGYLQVFGRNRTEPRQTPGDSWIIKAACAGAAVAFLAHCITKR
jgi:hypothetical protein